MLYKNHTIKIDPFRAGWTATITGPLFPCSRMGTFETKNAATAYAKKRIDEETSEQGASIEASR